MSLLLQTYSVFTDDLIYNVNEMAVVKLKAPYRLSTGCKLDVK